MKKRYISPASEAICFNTESLMAAVSSLPTDPEGPTVPGSDAGSQGRGWSSENWSSDDED